MSISVAHVLWSGSFGGIATLVLDLVKAQLQAGEVHPSVVLGRDGDVVEGFQHLGVETTPAKLTRGSAFSVKKYRAMRNVFGGKSVIHFHGYNPLLAAAAIDSGRPIVFTEHGNFGFGRSRRLADFVRPFLLRRFLTHSCHLVTFNSHFSQKLAETKYGLQGVRSQVIYNGVDFQRFQCRNAGGPVDVKVDENQFVVGTASRFAGVKRIHLLIEAFRRFRQQESATLLLVGDGSLRKSLEATVSEAGLTESTVFTGYTSEVQSYLQRMDVCVFPSINESFGIGAVESLSLGKPTIVFEDGGGLVEVAGVVCREDTVRDVSELVDRLAYYSEDRSRLTEREDLRKRYARTFGIETAAREFLAAYRNCLSDQ